MGQIRISIDKQVEIEELVDFNKFKVEGTDNNGYLRVTHPYTYFKFDHNGDFKGLIINCIEVDTSDDKKEIEPDYKTISVILYPGVDINKDLSDAYKTYFWFHRLVHKDRSIKHSGWFEII